MLKPLFIKLGYDPVASNAERNQKARMHYWDALVAAFGGDYKGVVGQADMVEGAFVSSKDADKMHPNIKEHALVNFKQKNYDKALEHALELNPDNIYYTIENQSISNDR